MTALDHTKGRIKGIRGNADGSFTICDTEECCPTIAFGEDGSAVITDGDQKIPFTPRQAKLLADLLAARQTGR